MSDATLEGPLEGPPRLPLAQFDLGAAGYAVEEWLMSGRASGYALAEAAAGDRRWDAHQEAEADYRTRIVVVRPADAARFSGTVVVEWLNVTGGIDAGPDWLFLHRHLMREGAVWVGVSAQRVGIEGGGLVPGMPLKQADPERYGSLSHPGDRFAFGIYSAAARALRAGARGPLGGYAVERLIAVGESQSAAYLATHANVVDPLERGFDAYLIHGRPGVAAPLDGAFLGRRGGEEGDARALEPAWHRVREDVRVPVLTLQSETDVVTLGGVAARQPDTERFRLWEVAGAAHFDTYGMVASHADDGTLPIAELARRMAPTDRPLGLAAAQPINAGPQQHYVVNAALWHLERQLRDGHAPPRAQRLESDSDGGRGLRRDRLGIALGGVRTPWVDAPTSVLSGLGQTGEGFLFLFGTTQVLDPTTLARLYPGGAAEHLERFEAALAEALSAGFLLEADADEIRALARHGRQPSGLRGED